VETIDTPRLPPLLQPIPVEGSAFDAAYAHAAAGADPGTLTWTPRRDRLDCAVVLAPDRPLAQTRPAVCVVLLALADALGALGPPKVAVRFGWPDRVVVNGALAGGLRFAAPPGVAEAAVPDWAVVGVTVDVLGAADDDSPGLHPERTALREEGFGDLSPLELLESFARHLLARMDAWESDGFAPLRRDWLRHADRTAMPDADLAEDGALLTGGSRRDLATALRTPSWTLPEATP